MPEVEGKWDRSRERKLLQRAKNGDTTAFEELIKSVQKRIYFCLAKMVFDHDQIDELLQESFIKAYKAMYRFDEKYPFYPWVRRIAVNTAINYMKSRAAHNHYSLDSFENPEALMISDGDPQQAMEQNELLLSLQKALHSLSPEQKVVFALRTQENMSYEEIAQTLEVSVGTVMSRLNRARTRLKTLLQDYL